MTPNPKQAPVESGEVADADLFRAEVLDSDSARAFGDVVLVYPVSNYVMLALALALLALFGGFAFIGEYTRHASVSGVLEPSQGVVKLYASQAGVLKTALVKEGQSVRMGDVLLVFASEHLGANGRAVEAELDGRLNEQLDTLRKERGGSLKLHEADSINLRQNLVALQSNRVTLEGELKTQGKRVQLAEQTLVRFERLQQSGFMPDLQTQQKTDDLMDQQLRHQSLQKAATSADAEIARLRRELENSPMRRQVATAQIDRNISSTESELSKQKIGRDWAVVAPCDGVVTSLTISHNQNASGGVPLVSIVPGGSKLEATL